MKKLIGYTLFWMGIGMIIVIIIPNAFCELIAVVICLMLGYNLFC